MHRYGALRRKKDDYHAAQAALHIEGAQRGEVHTVLEKNDLAHGPHLGAPHGHGETMKCNALQGDA